MLLLLLIGLPTGSVQAAGPPLIASTTFSEVTETAATLQVSVDPNGARVKHLHFDYIPLTAYEADSDKFGEGTLSTPDASLPAEVEGTGNLTVSSTLITNLTISAGSFAPGQTIKGAGIPAATTIIEATATTITLSTPATATTPGAALTATGAQPVSATLTGLTPATGYRFRLFAESNKGESIGSELTFYTYPEAPAFGPCPNDAFRAGEYAPFGHPSARLPDCRAYEQVSPVDKNGNDALGYVGLSHAATDGQAATFIATSGIPGGDGAQQIPDYLATRGAESWSTTGLEPQATAGPRARILGWTPDFSETVTQAVRQSGTTLEGALYVRSDPAAPATQASAYVPMSGDIQFAYSGASADGATIVFEAPLALPPREGDPALAGARPAAPNVYAYDAATGLVSLASVMNTGPETEAALPKGAFAGAYEWAVHNPGRGGSVTSNYTADQHAVAADGSVFFTASGTGQLYERVNPTEEQSPVSGTGKCENPTLACTIHVSASEKNNGTGGGTDSAGPQPAAFQAASADGSQILFSSSEKLTNDANTGPEQPAAQIGRANLADPDPDATKNESFIPAHALGVAVDPKGDFIYWVDPLKDTIARADLKAPNPAATVEEEYIVPGETQNVTFDKGHPSIQKGPSIPHFVAVDEEHVYWTNTGPLGNNPAGLQNGQQPILAGGTIGRATIGAIKAEDIRPEFIKGASDPQGIAVNDENIYWGNTKPMTEGAFSKPAIARAPLSGEAAAVEQEFFITGQNQEPMGLALSADHLYFGIRLENIGAENGGSSFVSRIPLVDPKDDDFFSLNGPGVRGITLNGSYIYWAIQSQGEEAIGRLPIADFPELGPCAAVATCEEKYLTPSGSAFGLAADSSRIYWSVNGETPPNPGNDLYRYTAAPDSEGHHLTDLTPDTEDPNGAEVIGVLGTTADGSHTYFVANGDLDESGPAFAGECHGATLFSTSGRCNLYLYHDGQVSFVAPLRLGGQLNATDTTDVVPRAEGLFGSAGVVEKSSFIAADGSLVFRSQENQPPYETHGVAQFYRFAPGEGLTCLTCNPTGGPSKAVGVEVNLRTPGMGPLNPAFTLPHAFSAGGDHFFFQTSAALVAADTDGQAGCPLWEQRQTTTALVCQDVYEWEAPGSGSCGEGKPPYSPLNHGCLYLLSPGDDTEPAFFSDAAADGSSAFFYTRDKLVGGDTDGLIDLYAARVGGGLAAQGLSPQPPCEGEASCTPAASTPPGGSTPQTPGFVGPENPKQPKCSKGKVLRKRKCVKKNKHKKHRHHPHASHGRGRR